MSTRIPSSLNWLIKKRARLHGRIQRAHKVREEAERLGAALPGLQADLEAIDRALQMHEIPVEPENIRSVSVQQPRVALPYGVLTKTLLLYLRSNIDTPFSTDALTQMVLDKFPNLQEKVQSYLDLKQLRIAVGKRLRVLAAEKVITRLPVVPGSILVQWVMKG